MKLTPLGANKNEIELGNGTVILFSYSTPVAACLNGENGVGFIRTSTKYSVTTSKHINQWLGGANAQEVDQSVIDALTV